MKIITYILLLVIIIFVYLFSTDKKANHGFSTVLYTGEPKVKATNPQPSKLKWFDSFKGIDNMRK